jgi:hypothetical protein
MPEAENILALTLLPLQQSRLAVIDGMMQHAAPFLSWR